jgi:hypothetical protein
MSSLFSDSVIFYSCYLFNKISSLQVKNGRALFGWREIVAVMVLSQKFTKMMFDCDSCIGKGLVSAICGEYSVFVIDGSEGKHILYFVVMIKTVNISHMKEKRIEFRSWKNELYTFLHIFCRTYCTLMVVLSIIVYLIVSKMEWKNIFSTRFVMLRCYRVIFSKASAL